MKMGEPDCTHKKIVRLKLNKAAGGGHIWRCEECNWPFLPTEPLQCGKHGDCEPDGPHIVCQNEAEWVVEHGDDPDPMYRCSEHVVDTLTMDYGVTNHVYPLDEKGMTRAMRAKQ